VFGRRKREEEAAAEAAREAERRALFAKLAKRPEHICPFLGLASERTEYVEGISDEHRCFAFGDPAPLSAEQQTRVCQERGYGNCPRYLRGVLVIPTEELEALRRPHAPLPEPAAAAASPADERRRRSPILLLLLLLLLAGGGGAAAFFLLNQEPGVGIASPTPTPSATSEPTPSPSPAATAAPTAPATPSPTPTPAGTSDGTPTPEPTPTAGDAFAFYEVSVGPEGYTLYDLDGDGEVAGTREASFGNFSFAEVEPVEGADGDVYWVTQSGGLAGWAYTWPDSGDFRIRAVFLTSDGERRSVYLDEEELTVFPESTPAP
jgi:cell division septation protein DedD